MDDEPIDLIDRDPAPVSEAEPSFNSNRIASPNNYTTRPLNGEQSDMSCGGWGGGRRFFPAEDERQAVRWRRLAAASRPTPNSASEAGSGTAGSNAARVSVPLLITETNPGA